MLVLLPCLSMSHDMTQTVSATLLVGGDAARALVWCRCCSEEQRYLWVVMKSTVSTPQPGSAKKASNHVVEFTRQFESCPADATRTSAPRQHHVSTTPAHDSTGVSARVLPC